MKNLYKKLAQTNLGSKSLAQKTSAKNAQKRAKYAETYKNAQKPLQAPVVISISRSELFKFCILKYETERLQNKN